MVVFWSVWLAAAIALIVVFLCKVPAFFMKHVITSICGTGDLRILTANLQDGVSILCEPSDEASRYFARYQIYERNSRRKFFIGEWKYSIDSAQFRIFCYDKNGAIVDVLRVNERVDKKLYSNVYELPQTTDYIVLRLSRINGERRRVKPFNKLFCLWLALFALSIAAAVCAALVIIYAYLVRVFPDIFNFGWGSITLSSVIVCAIAAIAYAAAVAWLLFSRSDKIKRGNKKLKVKGKGSGFISRVKNFFSAVLYKVRNVLQLALWSFPLRVFTLRKREAVPNEHALKQLKKDEDK